MTTTQHQVVATGSGDQWHASIGQTKINFQGQEMPITLCGKKIVASYVPDGTIVTCPHCKRKMS